MEESDTEEMESKTWFKCSLLFRFSVCFALIGMLWGGFLLCMIVHL